MVTLMMLTPNKEYIYFSDNFITAPDIFTLILFHSVTFYVSIFYVIHVNF